MGDGRSVCSYDWEQQTHKRTKPSGGSVSVSTSFPDVFIKGIEPSASFSQASQSHRSLYFFVLFFSAQASFLACQWMRPPTWIHLAHTTINRASTVLNLNLGWLLYYRPSYLSPVLLSAHSQHLSIFTYCMQTIFKFVNMKHCKQWTELLIPGGTWVSWVHITHASYCFSIRGEGAATNDLLACGAS